MIRAIGAMIAGVVAWEAVVLLATFAGRLVWPAYAVVEQQRAFALDMLLSRLAVGVLATLAFGAVVTWVARGDRTMIRGIIALALLYSVVDHIIVWDQFPVWYHLLYLAYIVPLAVIGGRLVKLVPRAGQHGRGFPTESSLDPRVVADAWFTDSYQAPLNTPALSVTDLFEAVLGHSPEWIKTLLIVRNRIAGWAGLDVPADATIRSFEGRADYAVGETIGPWPIFHLSKTELIAGRDNRHLDFRLSVLKLDGPAPTVAFSTLCTVHNMAGKIYLFFILPFHKWGMEQLMRRAIAAGRL